MTSSTRPSLELTGARKLGVIGALAVCACLLIVFYPALRLGFFNDDWWLIADAGRMNLQQYLRFYFDPFTQTIWYRPVHGILVLLEYTFWTSNEEGYHWVQNLIHLANSLLLFACVYQASRRWRAAFISALLFAVLFPGSLAVFQITVHDPLAWLFYLSTLLLWLNYLAAKRPLLYWLSMGSYMLALMSKETSATLIVTMFMVDRLILSEEASLGDLLRRYASFVLILLVYVAIEYRIQTQGHFTNRAGYSIGIHVVENLWHYLGLLISPWGLGGLTVFIGLLVILVLTANMLVQKRKGSFDFRAQVFLGIQFLLCVAPVLGLPSDLFESRYLYAASAVSAIAIALLFEWAWMRIGKSRVAIVAFSLGVAMLATWHGLSTVRAAAVQEEANKEMRVPFRDIAQQHPTYPQDTYLYFINSPYLLKHFAPSVFFFRYGNNVTIGDAAPEWWGGGTEPQPAGLREHPNSFIYYYDETGRRLEIHVDPSANTSPTPALPVTFQNGIRLDGYEISHARLDTTDTLAVLLYWRAESQINQDYTVFVHLLDQNGQVVSGVDNQPQNDAAPTTTWKPDKLVVDPHMLPIPAEVPAGDDYRLEIGLYYLPTMERLSLIDQTRRAVTDKLVIQPFSIKE